MVWVRFHCLPLAFVPTLSGCVVPPLQKLVSRIIPSNMGNYNHGETICDLTLFLLQDIDLQKVETKYFEVVVLLWQVSTSMSNPHCFMNWSCCQPEER